MRRRRIDHEQPAPGCSAAHPPGSRAGRALAPLLELQARISALPAADGLLAEFAKTREGWHLFVYPFAGRGVHEGLAALLALRWSRLAPNTFGFAVNDYGLALTAHARTQMDADTLRALLDPAQLFDDLRDGANLGELARRQFREIARVAGLLPPSLPGRALRSLRQLQASGRQLLRLPEVPPGGAPGAACLRPRPARAVRGRACRIRVRPRPGHGTSGHVPPGPSMPRAERSRVAPERIAAEPALSIGSAHGIKNPQRRDWPGGMRTHLQDTPGGVVA